MGRRIYAPKIRCSNLLSRDEGDSKLLVNHKSKDSHHGGTSLVKFDGTLFELGLGRELVPSVVNESISVEQNKEKLATETVTEDTPRGRDAATRDK